jgi:GNAT superfamily N-acetyltransferase
MPPECPSIDYAREESLDVDDFIDVLRRSTLAERRPVHDRTIMEQMVRQADLIITARCGGLLVGVSRALTDFCFCTYLSCLAVDQKFQRRGIGRELIRRTHDAAGPHTTLILIAAPKAMSYYPHIGLQPHPSCWTIPPRTAPSSGT